MTLELSACPAAGTGVHSWIMSAANWCRRRGMNEADAVQFISARITRRPNPPNEIQTAVAKAYRSSRVPQGAWSNPNRRVPVPLSDIEYNKRKLQAAAAKIQQPANWRHWLWERSPKRPETQNALAFLSCAFRSGETVAVFDAFKAKIPRWTIPISRPMDCRVPGDMRDGGLGAGIWYLSNPVDGRWHPNPRTQTVSCRSEESVTDFRHAVIESDVAPPNLWLAFLVQLPLRIVAFYTSGGKSVHALIRVDAKTKVEWDKSIEPLRRPLKVLGGDVGCLSAVRLTRLPGCRRPEKGGFQRLLFLSPEPPPARLIDLPVLRTRRDELARWIRICPRWNSSADAEL